MATAASALTLLPSLSSNSSFSLLLLSSLLCWILLLFFPAASVSELDGGLDFVLLAGRGGIEQKGS